MKKPDDSSLTGDEYDKVRTEAERILRQADALGRFPTPVNDIMAAAKVEEVPDNIFDEGFIARMRYKAGSALKRAVSKVFGVFDARARLIFIDHTQYSMKQTFIRLHETGHGFMAWQREMYTVVEECEMSLAPDVADLFDREANVFAAEVLFQRNTFAEEANEHEFSILTPVNLSSKYGASIYASVRQYVLKNWRACTVLVLDMPEPVQGYGFRATLRRCIASPRFLELFGAIQWQNCFTPSDPIGAMIPTGSRKISGKHTLRLCDCNDNMHECIAEAFTQGHQIFILIHAVKTLTAFSIIVPTRATI